MGVVWRCVQHRVADGLMNAFLRGAQDPPRRDDDDTFPGDSSFRRLSGAHSSVLQRHVVDLQWVSFFWPVVRLNRSCCCPPGSHTCLCCQDVFSPHGSFFVLGCDEKGAGRWRPAPHSALVRWLPGLCRAPRHRTPTDLESRPLGHRSDPARRPLAGCAAAPAPLLRRWGANGRRSRAQRGARARCCSGARLGRFAWAMRCALGPCAPAGRGSGAAPRSARRRRCGGASTRPWPRAPSRAGARDSAPPAPARASAQACFVVCVCVS